MNLWKHRAVRNAGWIAGGRLAGKALAFLVGILAARCLGPENYGLVNYAAAYITLFAALCTLGLPQVTVRELIRCPRRAGETMGTAVGLRLISALLSVVMIVGLALIMDGDEPLTLWVVGLCSLSLLFQAFDALGSWFQAGLKSKFAVAAALTGYALGSVYKLALLTGGKSVVWFALTGAVDHLAAAIFLLLAYRRCGGPKLTFSRNRGRELLVAGRGFLLSGLMVSVYTVCDRVMLRRLLGDTAVGGYAAALSLATVWAFLLTAIIDSAAPELTALYDRDRAAFDRRTGRLYAGIFWGSAAIALALTVLAGSLVALLYGAEYAPAAGVLRILAWSTGLSYLGVARNIWVACKGCQGGLLPLYGVGAALNIVLNLTLIPPFGAAGAAWATLITQGAVTFLIPLLIPALRPNVRLMTEGLALRGIFKKQENRSDLK